MRVRVLFLTATTVDDEDRIALQMIEELLSRSSPVPPSHGVDEGQFVI
jgi:hypothetical protein